MKILKGVMLAAVMAGVAFAEHGAPTTRPVAPAEPDVHVQGESAPIELKADGYTIRLSWFPAAPKPGDLVQFRADVSVPGVGQPRIVLRAGITRTGPGGNSVLLPRTEIPAEANPSDGRYTFQQVLYLDGVYQVDLGVDDLSQGKHVSVNHTLTMGQPQSGFAVYGVAICGLAAIAVVLAFGLRKPATPGAGQ